LAPRYNVMGVPKTVINDTIEVAGATSDRHATDPVVPHS